MKPYNFHIYKIFKRTSAKDPSLGVEEGSFIYFNDRDNMPVDKHDVRGRYLIRIDQFIDFFKSLNSDEIITNHYSIYIRSRTWKSEYRVKKTHNNNKVAIKAFGREFISKEEGLFFHKGHIKVRFEGKEYLVDPDYIPNIASFNTFKDFVVAGRVVTSLKEVKSGTIREI